MCRADVAPAAAAAVGHLLAEMARVLAASEGVPASEVRIGPVDLGPEPVST